MALKIDNKIVHSSATEVLMQNVHGFEQGTAGAITLGSDMIQGDFSEFSMLGEIANIIGRRDVASDADATVKTLSSIDGNDVKVYFSTGAIEFKLVDAKRYGTDSMAFSQAIGEQIGIGITNYMLNKVITAGVGALTGNTAVVTGDGTATIDAQLLNTALKPFGDARGNVVAWIMNGTTFNDLVKDQLTIGTAGDVTANGVLYTESVGTLGRPVYVTDAAGLAITSTDGTATPSNAVLGLTRGALKIIESEAREFYSEIVSGKENLKYRIQAESSMLLGVSGYKYTSTANPDDAVLATGSNWVQIASDVKSTAGVLINVA
jgi:hypothetical protein